MNWKNWMSGPVLGVVMCFVSATFAETPATAPAAGLADRPNPTIVPTGPESVIQTAAGTLFSGWKLTPAGVHVRAGDMALKMVLSPDGKTLLASCGGKTTGLAVIDVEKRETKQFIKLDRAFNGIAFAPDKKTFYVTGANSDRLHVFTLDNGTVTLQKTVRLLKDANLKPPVSDPTATFITGITVHPDNGTIYVCCESRGEVWVIDPENFSIKDNIRVGAFPHSCVMGYGNRYLYVSNWGDRTVSAINLKTSVAEQSIAVGVRPNDMVVAPDGRLYVSCAGDNSVHVLQTKSLRVNPKTNEAIPPPDNALEIISTSLYPQSPEGSTPSGVAVSPDGKTLFVVNCDNNDVAVIDITNSDIANIVGFVPTGWYPTAVVSNGQTLMVANGKGLADMGANAPSREGAKRRTQGVEYDHPTGLLTGSISFIDAPTGAELNAYTKQVRDNSPYTPESLRRSTVAAKGSVIPQKPGDPCPIKHVLYIIKENRTYDQLLGDLTDSSGKPLGNGDPKLCSFGEKITPNHHKLAREYVVLDNLYCSGEVSVDGHSWCDGAIATDYRQRSWTVSYTGHGNLPGNDEMDTPAGGFIWDSCKRAGVSFMCYGEGRWDAAIENRGSWEGRRDPERVTNFLKDLKKFEDQNSMPQFMIMSLGEDHTTGTKPDTFTPNACVASNDQALGQIVDEMSKSKFWSETAIFIIEDDAQNGPDHVDAHRTVGLVISPYTKRGGVVDSTPYTTVSMVRTMELILGLPPMTQYDAAATPMYNTFANKPEMVAYDNLPPQVDLTAKNTIVSFGAAASAEMDFDEYDDAPEDELNRILWAVTMGETTPYPTPHRQAVFTR